MVNNDIENKEEIEDITDGVTDMTEPELEEIEDEEENKLKQLRNKLKLAEEDKRKALEELALAKADFLNARKRLDEDRKRGIVRQKIKDIEALLPLCDSFSMAMADKEVWEAADDRWRKGIEGIHSQLQQILSAHDVHEMDPTGDIFDPNLHDAIGTEPVDDESKEGTIVTVLQKGYVIDSDDTTETIRAARVTTGTKQTEN